MKNPIMSFIYTLILKNGERIYDVKSNGQIYIFSITFEKSTKYPYRFGIGPNKMIYCTDKYDIFDYSTMALESQ